MTSAKHHLKEGVQTATYYRSPQKETPSALTKSQPGGQKKRARPRRKKNGLLAKDAASPTKMFKTSTRKEGGRRRTRRSISACQKRRKIDRRKKSQGAGDRGKRQKTIDLRATITGNSARGGENAGDKAPQSQPRIGGISTETKKQLRKEILLDRKGVGGGELQLNSACPSTKMP